MVISPDPSEFFWVKEHREDMLILDVRTREEHRGAPVKGAMNIPFEDVDRCLDFLREAGQPVIVFSTNGIRSRKVAIKLKNHGIPAMDGGSKEEMLAWLGLKA